jgi:DNA-binding PadR family transcriptional regulator
LDLLTRLEEAILIAVIQLGDDAYGVPINREVSRIFSKKYTLGALYFALDQLVRKELLMKTKANPTGKRGGRSKTYYRLTPEGKTSLEAVRKHNEKLWEAVPRIQSAKG